MLTDAREHAWTDFFSIVKSKGVIWPASFREGAVRTFLPLDTPAAGEERFQYPRGFSCAPLHNRIDERLE